MEKGNQHLLSRRKEEEGESEGDESEWSISSKINKAMMFLYVLNIILIVVWFLKHL